MESQVLEERIEREARRVAAALGIETFTRSSGNANITNFHITNFHADYQGLNVWWSFDSRPDKPTLCVFDIEKDGKRCQVSLLNIAGANERWMFYPHGEFHEIMARWLYCLGFDDKNVLSRLPDLTAHEKLELRLSLPREFWPRTWLDEED